MLLGTQCNPPPTPPSCGTGECATDQVTVCLDRCEAPAEFGQSCSNDPCDESAPVCGPGLSCADFGFGQATCVARPGLAGLFCTTSAPHYPCSAGSYCRGFADAVDDAYACEVQRPDFLPQAFDGQCVPPAREGSTCDASWGEPGCAVCEPGTECLTDPRDASARVCLRPCATADDCVCPSDDLAVLDTCQTMLPEPSGDQGACTGCAVSGQECSVSAWGCCDSRDECRGGQCCRALGAVCEAGECCGGAQCIDSSCRECGSAGSPPDAVLGCCSGLEVVDGVCSVPCTNGDPCSPPGCPDRVGVTECSPTGATCVVEISPEVCNGVDDDCDGSTDNGLTPQTCSADPGGCGRTFMGTQRCTGGAWGECRIADFCRYQYNGTPLVPGVPHGFSSGSGVSPSDCHWNRRLCDSDMPGGGGDASCPPGKVCISDCENVAVCWPHDQTLSCIDDIRWSALPCNGVLCWAAADLDSTSPPGGALVCQ